MKGKLQESFAFGFSANTRSFFTVTYRLADVMRHVLPEEFFFAFFPACVFHPGVEHFVNSGRHGG